MVGADHSVQFLVSHFKEDIDRFLRNLVSGFIYLLIERNRFHFRPVPPTTDLGGAGSLTKENLFFFFRISILRATNFIEGSNFYDPRTSMTSITIFSKICF